MQEEQFVQKILKKLLEEVKELQNMDLKKLYYQEYIQLHMELDLEGNINLITIIEEIEKIDGIERVRIGSIEPAFFTEEVIEKIKEFEKAMSTFPFITSKWM